MSTSPLITSWIAFGPPTFLTVNKGVQYLVRMRKGSDITPAEPTSLTKQVKGQEDTNSTVIVISVRVSLPIRPVVMKTTFLNTTLGLVKQPQKLIKRIMFSTQNA